MRSDKEYKLLPDAPRDSGEGPSIDATTDNYAASGARRCTLRAIVIIQSFLLVTLLSTLAWVLYQYLSVRARMPSFHVYSPADDAVKYQAHVFTAVPRPKNIYLRYPTPEVDKAWGALYDDFGISQIPRSQAQLLVNKTLPIPADPDYYIIGLSNYLRKGLYPEYYIDPVTGALEDIPKEDITLHLTHCIDVLRQGIICAGDISPVVFQWDSYKQSAMAHMDIVHTCRSYDKITEWAKKHKLLHPVNHSIHVQE